MKRDRASREEAVARMAAFRVGGEEYVVDIMRVREIIRPMPVTPVRMGPRFVEGVINLRGSVVPLIDMRRRFDLPAEDHPQRKIIVMSVEGRVVGMMVDGVTEVVRVPRSDIRPAPELFTEVQAPFFMGICEYRGRTLVLLNVKNVVASEDEIVLPDTSVILGAEG